MFVIICKDVLVLEELKYPLSGILSGELSI